MHHVCVGLVLTLVLLDLTLAKFEVMFIKCAVTWSVPLSLLHPCLLLRLSARYSTVTRILFTRSLVYFNLLIRLCLLFPHLASLPVPLRRVVTQACQNGNSQHLEHLLFYGADSSSQNASGNTALHICALYNKVDKLFSSRSNASLCRLQKTLQRSQHTCGRTPAECTANVSLLHVCLSMSMFAGKLCTNSALPRSEKGHEEQQWADPLSGSV